MYLSPKTRTANLAGEHDEQARRFGWFPRGSSLAGVRATIATGPFLFFGSVASPFERSSDARAVRARRAS
jgi:hypothetical protein